VLEHLNIGLKSPTMDGAAAQLALNGWKWRCLDVLDMGISCAAGALGYGFWKNAKRFHDVIHKSKQAAVVARNVANAKRINAARQAAEAAAQRELGKAVGVVAGAQATKWGIDGTPLDQGGNGCN
jgi:hypothetical protein